jgi:hypothetical protein
MKIPASWELSGHGHLCCTFACVPTRGIESTVFPEFLDVSSSGNLRTYQSRLLLETQRKQWNTNRVFSLKSTKILSFSCFDLAEASLDISILDSAISFCSLSCFAANSSFTDETGFEKPVLEEGLDVTRGCVFDEGLMVWIVSVINVSARSSKYEFPPGIVDVVSVVAEYELGDSEDAEEPDAVVDGGAVVEGEKGTAVALNELGPDWFLWDLS